MKEENNMTVKEYAYTSLCKISESLFIASIDILCYQENDMDSINLAQFMLELHEAIDSFTTNNCDNFIQQRKD